MVARNEWKGKCRRTVSDSYRRTCFGISKVIRFESFKIKIGACKKFRLDKVRLG